MLSEGLADVGKYLTEHVPTKSTHDVEEKVPEPPLDHVTTPVGDSPETVALHLAI